MNNSRYRRYDSATGTFTVPSDGDGYYYFSTYFLINGGEYGYFDIEINGNILCTSGTDHDDTSYPAQAACSGAAYITEGFQLWHLKIIDTDRAW